jgi:hypothetical protein
MNDAAVSDPKGDQAMVAGRPKDGLEVVMECPLLAQSSQSWGRKARESPNTIYNARVTH